MLGDTTFWKGRCWMHTNPPAGYLHNQISGYFPDCSTPGLPVLDGAFWVQHNLAYSIFMANSFIHWNLRLGLKLCWRRWLIYRFCHQAKILDCLRIGYWGSIPSCSPVILLSYYCYGISLYYCVSTWVTRVAYYVVHQSYFCYTIVILLCPSMGYLGGIPSCSPVIHTLVILLSHYCYTNFTLLSYYSHTIVILWCEDIY